MSVTITLHLWWLAAYLGAGLILLVPLERWAYSTIHNPGESFWRMLARNITLRGLIAFLFCWPYAIWELR